jgi:DNA-binding HxlR family transcriptional regulator
MRLRRLRWKYENWTDRDPAWWQTADVRGYGQYCPVAKAAEVLGERWTLLIVRDLITGAHRFTDLHRGLPGISRTLLSERLRRLEADGLVERRRSDGGRGEYWLTPLGRDLEPAVLALGEWAVRNFGRDPIREEMDPDILMLWIERNARRDGFPRERLVARFEFRGSRPPRAWLVVEDQSPSICHDDPGFEADVVISADLKTLHRVFAGRYSLSAALRDGSLTLEGSPQQRRAFTKWFGLSPFAPAAREALAG